MSKAIRSIASALVGAALLMAAATPSQPALAHPDGHGGHQAQDHGHGHGFAAGEPGNAGQPARVVEIVMGEGDGTMSYSPSRIEARRGEQIKFVLKNAGQLRHELMIDSFERNAAHKAEMEKSPDMGHADPNGRHIEPGQSVELIWRFTKAGSFEYACLIPGHYEAGMKGIVVVR